MELPDFLKYKDKYSNEGFTDKISRIAKRSGAKLVYAALILYYTLQSDKVSVKDKAIILGALGYLISPLDVVPDAIPIAGLGDDLAVLMYVIHKVWSEVSDDVKAKARGKLAKWFDEDEQRAADALFENNVEDEPV
ncbi:MAG: YkvA family protein [Prevotella sp.]|nr:YkvA family protein [Prevotella sp.]